MIGCMENKEVLNILDELYPDPKCELNYTKDYELLIATLLSAQSTDKRVNVVTKELFSKYDVYNLAKANVEDIEKIIHPVGMSKKKAQYIKDICQSLVQKYDGNVPNDRNFLESLPGVGRKTCNVFLVNIYNEPAIAVDTHVTRVANRLGLTKSLDVSKIEQDLMNYFPKDKWGRVHHQLVLFGRYICKAKKPECQNCPFQTKCSYHQ